MDRSILETARFRATAGAVHGFGATPHEALSALMERIHGDAPTPIVIWPYNHGDAFFTDAQNARLQELKSRRDALTATERSELEALVEAALDATVLRTRALPSVK